MEAAALWISLVAALGTGASAIMAWTARSDALKAQESAEEAQNAAVEAWQRAAGALEKANDLQLKISEEAISRDRLQVRTAIAEALRRWYTEHAMRLALGTRPSTAESREKRELAMRLSGTGEPGASSFALALEVAMRSVVSGEVSTAMSASIEVMNAARAWIRDPEAYLESNRDLMDEDAMREELATVQRLFDQATNPEGS